MAAARREIQFSVTVTARAVYYPATTAAQEADPDFERSKEYSDRTSSYAVKASVDVEMMKDSIVSYSDLVVKNAIDVVFQDPRFQGEVDGLKDRATFPI